MQSHHESHLKESAPKEHVNYENKPFWIEKDQVPYFLDKYFDWMNKKETIPGQMRTDLFNIRQLLLSRVIDSPESLYLIRNDIGSLEGQKKDDFLEELRRDFNKCLLHEHFQGFILSCEITFLCLMSRIPKDVYYSWLSQ